MTMHRRLWPAVICSLFLITIISAILFRARQICDGHFGYPIDDTYIHMAVAKNFALHGVWGVTRYGFSSSTSSPFFTLLLAATYKVFGLHEASSLALNILFAFLLIVWCCYLLARTGLPARRVWASVTLLILVIPLSALTIVGMEHVLHALLSLIFVHFAGNLLTRSSDGRITAGLFVVTPFLVMTRYEGTFLVLAAGVLFLLRGHWGIFAAIGLLSGLPLAAYAAISVERGWAAIPNSLLLKANLPGQSRGGYSEFLTSLARTCLTAPHLPLLLLLAAGLLALNWKKYDTVWTYASVGLLLFLAAGTLHFLFARVGWYFRYEAYLVALGGVTCIVASSEIRGNVSGSRRYAAIALTVLLLIALGVRTARSIYLTPRAIRNIYDQQYQSARFVHQFYDESTLVANDIGAVCYFTDARVLDPIGLGNMEPATVRFQGRYSSAWLLAWAKTNGAQLAIVYPDVEPPPEWPLVGMWSIPDRWIVGRDNVSLYAVNPAIAPLLRDEARVFQEELPRGVRWAGM